MRRRVADEKLTSRPLVVFSSFSWYFRMRAFRSSSMRIWFCDLLLLWLVFFMSVVQDLLESVGSQVLTLSYNAAIV